MAVVIDGSLGISPVTASGTSASVDGMTVGRGGGEVATNTAVGASALAANTTGSNTTAVGYQAGYSNTTGVRNVFVGQGAGYSMVTNSENTFVGRNAGNLATGGTNTFVGEEAGASATTGTLNSFLGTYAGSDVTTGSKNTILGRYTGNQGGLDIRTASNYIVLSDGDGNPRTYIDTNGTVVSNTKNSSGQQVAISKLNITASTNTLVATIVGVNNMTAGSVIFEATVNNASGNDGYSVARSVRELLISSYGSVANLLKSTELSNNTGTVNASVINCTVTTSASVSGTTIQLYVNSTQTGVAATSTNTCTYKITIVGTATTTTFTLN